MPVEQTTHHESVVQAVLNAEFSLDAGGDAPAIGRSLTLDDLFDAEGMTGPERENAVAVMLRAAEAVWTSAKDAPPDNGWPVLMFRWDRGSPWSYGVQQVGCYDDAEHEPGWSDDTGQMVTDPICWRALPRPPAEGVWRVGRDD